MNSNDNKQKIIDCATTLFARRGYDAVSTLEITNAAEITKPTMYYYFGSKEGLLAEILKQKYTVFNNKLVSASSLAEDIALTFFRLCRLYFDYALEDLDFTLLKMGLTNRVGEDTAYLCAKPYIEQESEIIRNVFNIAASQVGNIKGKESLCTISFIGTVNSAVSSYLHTKDEKLLSDETIYRLRQQFLHGIYS